MRNHQASWSWSTAMRAVLLSANIPSYNSSHACTLDDIRECWLSDPICTSVVIVFWQRYLCQFAEEYNKMMSHQAPTDALDWIYQYMPLKADRTLPGDLLSTLSRSGWAVIDRAPHASQTGWKDNVRVNRNRTSTL